MTAPGTPYDKLGMSLHITPLTVELHEAHDARHHKKNSSGWRRWLSGRRALIPAAFVLGITAAGVFTVPDMLGSDLSDLWPMLHSDIGDFIGNMSLIDCKWEIDPADGKRHAKQCLKIVISPSATTSRSSTACMSSIPSFSCLVSCPPDSRAGVPSRSRGRTFANAFG